MAILDDIRPDVAPLLHDLIVKGAWSVGLGPKYLRRRGVVSNSVDPGPDRASAVESSKAPPERNMNLLQQVAALFRVAFVRPRQPFQRWTELRSCLGISPFL